MPKKKTQPAPEYKVYMTYSEDREGGKKCEGEEHEKWANREPTHITFSPIDLFVNAPDWSESIEVPFDPEPYIGKDIFVVIVRYQSDNTFGQSFGNWCVVGAYYTEQEAADEDDAIRRGEGKYSKDKYNAWQGYFERFENVEIHSFKLGEWAPGKGRNHATKVIRH